MYKKRKEKYPLSMEGILELKIPATYPLRGQQMELIKFFNFINSLKACASQMQRVGECEHTTRIRKFEEFKILQIFPDTLRV